MYETWACQTDAKEKQGNKNAKSIVAAKLVGIPVLYLPRHEVRVDAADAHEAVVRALFD